MKPDLKSFAARLSGASGFLCLAITGLLVGPTSPATAQVASGSYVGNGSGNHQITVGFQPDVVLVKGNDFDSAFTPTSAVLRTATMLGDASKPMVLDNALVPNQITSLDANGFTLGTDRRVNQPGINFYWVAFKADADMKVGTYTGNGTSQSITGVGFSPDYLVVVSSSARRAVQACSAAPAGRTFEFESAPWLANQITSLDANGFSVTHNAGAPYANENGVVYHYVAWNAASLKTAVGSYQGNAVDNRNITGLGFQPGYLIVKAIYNQNVLPSFTPPPIHRMAQFTGDAAVNFSNGMFAPDHIQAFQADGFQIGAAQSINRSYAECNADGPGCAYFYVAFSLVASDSSLMGTTETSTTLTVTAPDSFEMVFTRNASGGIEYFYDLAEDPGRTVDLVGGSGDKQASFLDSLQVGGTVYGSYGPNAGTMNLLEATPTRVRVRSESFYRQLMGTTILQGVKGYGDYSVYPSGRLALRWNRRATTAVTYETADLNLCVHRASGMLGSWTPYSQSGGFPGPGSDDFLLARSDVSLARTDFLHVMHRDWTGANGHYGAADATRWVPSPFFINEWALLQWQENSGYPLPAGSSEIWSFLTYFKPTNLGDHTDSAVTSRSADYRSPDSLSFVIGGPWNDASENTAADDFNEAEAAYVLDVDPLQGLQFDMDGSASNPRYQPFFKIRQWRSVFAPSTIRVEGIPMVRGVDYTADVKPVARAHFAQRLVWYSTLQGAAAVSTPDVGKGGTANGFFGSTPYGNGFIVSLDTHYLQIPTDDFDMARGAIEFWYQPSYASSDGTDHDIAGFDNAPVTQFLLRKTNANALVFSIVNAGTTSMYTVPAASFGWRAYDWVHVRLEWDDSVACSPICVGQQRILLNGVEPPGHADPTQNYSSTPPPAFFTLGKQSPGGANHAPGTYDEVHVYAGSATTPTSLAHGGLVTSANEYLADPARNFPLAFAPVAAEGQGEYLLLGADARFRGLNIVLSRAGAGVATGALEWEYWNGIAWADLESVPGFTDGTSSFTRNGTVYWTGDPLNWSPYSVNGGPDLYCVRVHLPAGAAYATAPIESVIKTDILLFQYRGDVTAPAQTFQFPDNVNANLEVTKSHVGSPAPGETINYTITVTNKGPEAVPSVIVTDSVSPPGTILGPSFSPAKGSYDSGTGTWTFAPPLLDGESAELTFTGTIDPFATGSLDNTVSVAPPPGFTDPDGTRDSSTDSYTLVPSVDLALNKTCPAVAVALGRPMTYTLEVTSAPSGATNVTVTDTLPPSMAFESAPAGCTYNGSTHTVTCTLASVGPAATQVTLTVRPQAVGMIPNTATVQWAGETGPVGNNESRCSADVRVFADDVRFFTVTSRSDTNVLEWVNPTSDYVPAEDRTRIVYKTTGYPTHENDGTPPGTALYDSGVLGPGGQGRYVHDTSADPNATYYYAAFVVRATPSSVSPGRFCKGRPANISGPVKWSFTTGATAMTPPTVGGTGVVAPSNDRVLYAMERGADAPGGEWPADWWPIELGDVVQSRSPVVPIDVQGTNPDVANPVVYLGAQDGSVYVVDATRGGHADFPWEASIGSAVQAAPAGIFSEFLPTLPFSYLLVGTRNEPGPNTFFALGPKDGLVKGRFDDANLGIINGMAAVDYANKRVYFTSRERVAGAGTNTLWCLRINDPPYDPVPVLELDWARALGDIDSSPVLRNGRVYVGNDGTVFSIDALNGDDDTLDRTFPHGDGQVKGFVFPDRSSRDLYFATERYVWAVTDDDPPAGMTNRFGAGISLGPDVRPSTVLFVPQSTFVYVGGSDGKIHEINVSNPPVQTAWPLGSGTVGAPSLDRGQLTPLLHVGTLAGVFYAIETPLPPGAMCVASCAGQFPGTACTSIGADPCTATCDCAGPLCALGDCNDGGGS